MSAWSCFLNTKTILIMNYENNHLILFLITERKALGLLVYHYVMCLPFQKYYLSMWESSFLFLPGILKFFNRYLFLLNPFFFINWVNHYYLFSFYYGAMHCYYLFVKLAGFPGISIICSWCITVLKYHAWQGTLLNELWWPE